MIFVTVGSQMPFDRMIEIVDQWAAFKPELDIVAQVGKSDKNFKHVDSHKLLTPTDFENYVKKSDFIIGHAGMGSILTSREYGKKILVMPRLSRFKETRNDHQVATARMLSSLNIVETFENMEELVSGIKKINSDRTLLSPTRRFVKTEVSQNLKHMIDGL